MTPTPTLWWRHWWHAPRVKTLAVPSATAALEACAGTVGRGFAASEVKGPDSLTKALDTWDAGTHRAVPHSPWRGGVPDRHHGGQAQGDTSGDTRR